MPSLNKVILIGRLTRDPELRYTSSGLAVASFTIAVDRRFKDQQTGERKTDFFRCTAWRQKAEFVNNYIHKGRLVCVEGSIELNEYTAQDGSRRVSPDIQCDNVETLEPPREGEAAPQGGAQGGGYNAAPGGASGGGEYFDDMGGGQQAAPRSQAAPAAARPPAQGAPRAPQGGQGAARPQGAPQGGQGGNRGPAPQPAYPQNDYDFDDSDPFADE
jgi:single-strand DNA-binding protein